MPGSRIFDKVDISELSKDKLIEEIEEAIETHEMLRVFMNSVEDGFSILDKDLNYLAVNETILRRTSLKSEEIMGRFIGDVAPNVVATGRLDTYRKVLDTGIPETIDNVTAFDEVRKLRIIAFKSGENLGLITRDITDVVKFEETLFELQRHASLLEECDTVEQVYDVTVDAMTNILKHNACDLLIIKGENLVQVESNNLPLDLKIPLDGPGLTVKAVRSKQTVLENNTGANPDYIIAELTPGEPYPTFPVSKSELVTPIIIDDKAFGVLNIESKSLNAFTSNDRILLEILAIQVASAIKGIQIFNEQLDLHKELIENRAKIEQSEDMNRLKTNFMSSATHEIRTPITSIKGHVDMIMEDAPNLDINTLLQYLEVIQRNVNRLELLSNELLENMRLELLRVELDYKTVNFPELIETALQEMQPILDSRNQRIKPVCVCTESWVSCDEARIIQVITNLISNASHYSEKCSEIHVECTDTEEMMKVMVRDSGIGIEGRDIPKLFTPFPDIQQTTVKRGTGLGLSICKGIIDLHGGKIWVESHGINKGTTVSFTLPKNI